MKLQRALEIIRTATLLAILAVILDPCDQPDRTSSAEPAADGGSSGGLDETGS